MSHLFRRLVPVALLACALVAPAGSGELADAIQAGRRDVALRLIGQGVPVTDAQADGTTALHWAVYRADLELAKRLVAAGARADTRNSYGASPIAEAARLGSPELVDLLVRAGADVDAANHDGQTALMLAIRTGSVATVERLLAHGAKVNVTETWRGQTPLMWAAEGRQAEMVRMLIRRGAKVDVRADAHDWSGWYGAQVTSEPRAQYKPTGGLTALLYAARSGCIACAEALLDAGADVDLPTPEGVTPLIIAIDNVNFDLAALLLERGANPSIADWWGRTPLYTAVDVNSLAARFTAGGTSFAEYNGIPEPGQRHTALDIARRLLEAGVDPDPQLNMHRPGRGGNSGRFVDLLLTTGATPLLRAAMSRDTAMVELLLKHGAQVDLPNVKGFTPLMVAAGLGNGGNAHRDVPLNGVDAPTRAIRTIDLLLAAGADINARAVDPRNRTSHNPRPSPVVDRAGQSALFGAVIWGKEEVIAHLVAKGADPGQKDDSGRVPADLAKLFDNGRDPKKIESLVAALGASPAR